MPTPQETSDFYEGQFYTSDGKRFSSLVERLRHFAGYARGRTLNRLASRPGLLLDYGSGAGHFASAQRASGWEVHTVDPYSAASQEAARATLDNRGNPTLHYPDAHFDAISLWYVLEHILDPQATLAELLRILKPGGILLLAVQDFSSIQARVFRDKWLILDPPRHIWQFAPHNLDSFLLRFGMPRVALTRSSLEFGPFTILQSALNCLTGNRNHLFRMLKHSALPTKSGNRASLPGAIASLIALPALAPLSLITYFALLAVGSSDVFTAYYRKPHHG
ncbi:methyltransferase domain protein [Desulfovibrio sp. A2]|nr:methyltransferase domain protein [Desulfovibrio sp. A2]